MSLSETKKFYLVDASQIKRSEEDEYKIRTKSLASKELQGLDREMMNIVNNGNLSTDDKVELYNSLLAKYQDAKTQTLRPPSEPKVLKPKESASVALKPMYDATGVISKQYKNKAETLWKIVKDDKNIDISSRGAVTIKGEPIVGSNISDMINKAVNPRQRERSVTGWNEFQQLLSDINVPKTLLAQQSKIPVPDHSFSGQKNDIYSGSPSKSNQKRLISYSDWETHDNTKHVKKSKKKKQR